MELYVLDYSDTDDDPDDDRDPDRDGWVIWLLFIACVAFWTLLVWIGWLLRGIV